MDKPELSRRYEAIKKRLSDERRKGVHVYALYSIELLFMCGWCLYILFPFIANRRTLSKVKAKGKGKGEEEKEKKVVGRSIRR